MSLRFEIQIEYVWLRPIGIHHIDDSRWTPPDKSVTVLHSVGTSWLRFYSFKCTCSIRTSSVAIHNKYRITYIEMLLISSHTNWSVRAGFAMRREPVSA